MERQRLIGCLIIWVAVLGLSRAQSPLTQTVIVNDRFDDPAAVQWIRTFKGTWQGLHSLEIVLGFDGRQYEGVMRCGEGNLLFDLTGSEKNGKITLQEIDSTGKTSGYLLVTITDGRMQGHWWSTDFDRAAEIRLRSDAVVELRSFSPDVLFLLGKVNNEDVALIIQREESDLLSGLCMIGEQKLLRFSGACTDQVCDKMTLAGLQGTDIKLTKQRGNTFNAQFSGDLTGQATLTLDQKMPLVVHRQYDYMGTVDCLYPTDGIPAFDTWIDGHMQSWMLEAEDFIAQQQQSIGTPGPQNRWQTRATAWVDMTMRNAQYICGFLTMFDLHEKQYKREAFIFDIRDEEPISLQEFVRKGQLEETILGDANASKDDRSGTLPFKYVAPCESGFIVISDFDALQGEQWTTLPYRRYAALLKKNNFVQDKLK